MQNTMIEDLRKIKYDEMKAPEFLKQNQNQNNFINVVGQSETLAIKMLENDFKIKQDWFLNNLMNSISQA